MYWALLQLGRRLVLPAEFASLLATVACEEVLQLQGLAAGIDRLAVDLMFPATEGTVQRLMASWWDAQVCCPGAWLQQVQVGSWVAWALCAAADMWQ